MSDFILSCCSTVDMPYTNLTERNIPVAFFKYAINGEEFVDDMGRDPNALKEFYGKISAGALPTTSQVNVDDYYNFFKGMLADGDVLHLAFSSGLSGSVNNAFIAAEMLREKFPFRRITVIDTTCASSGYGMIVDIAADMRDKGCSMEEVAAWVEENKIRLHHQFYATDLTHFRRGGRVSGAAAAIGTILNICPLMHLNNEGKIIAYSKARGLNRAKEATLNWMLEHAENGRDYGGYCYISNSNCKADAEAMRDLVEKNFPKLKGKVKIFDIGTIIGSHTGSGTVALFFMGDARKDS